MISCLKIENWKLKIPAKQAGFTMTELIVVMAIATVIMTALIINQNSWNDQLAVKTQAYNLVMMIRQAQIYSLGVREDTAGSGNKFNVSYGMYFSTTGGVRIAFFADRNGNHEYDSGEMIGSEIVLNRGVTLPSVCRSDLTCPGSGVKKVSITFKRPDPKSYLYFRTSPGVQFIGGPAFLVLHPPSGSDVVIRIEDNGQISIQ
jgi:prepilin-type N-terminal cleavage/methylation domain-containing protein